jgi:chromobox protein 1
MTRHQIAPGNQKRICCNHSPSGQYCLTNLNCRATASKILNEYLAKVGGKEAILEAWQEKKEASKKGKKRGRAGTGADATNGTKRGKKNGHPKDESPPTSASKAEWKPPTGNWEDLVTGIDACEGNDNNVVVYLTWKGGHKTQHPLAQVYKRCPQKVRTLISTIHHAILTDLTRC